MSRSPKVGEMNVAGQGGQGSLGNTYYNKYLKGRNNCALQLDAIVIFPILTPLAWWAKNHMKQPRVGLFYFVYISKIDI